MDATTISLLVNTLGPIAIPLIANAITWLFNKALSAFSPAHQALMSPFLPVVAGAVGTALGLTTGTTATAGLVGGLAATGAHQVVHQIVKAAKKS